MIMGMIYCKKEGLVEKQETKGNRNKNQKTQTKTNTNKQKKKKQFK